MKHPFLAVVDDEPGVRRVVTIALSQAGYAAQEFPDGREFLDRHHPATGGVILGIYMPVLDGRETLREMRRRGLSMPVITMSGVVPASGAEDLIALGAREHLPKPFKIADLLAAVGRVMG